MKRNFTRDVVGIVLTCTAMIVLINAPGTAVAKEETRTVTARVDSGSGSGAGIHAAQVPGTFTVPEGHVATNFGYHFHDPSSDYTSTSLGSSNIYSMTHGRRIGEAEGNPNFQLPPGKYKFVVGGRPGAYGSLRFRLVPTAGSEEEDPHAADHARLPGNFDVTYNPTSDIYISDNGGLKRLGDFEGIDFWNWPTQVVVRFRDGQVTSQFKIQASGNDYDHRHSSTLTGTLSNGRFTGTDTSNTQCQITYDGKPFRYNMGTVWALSGQVDAEGLLILHGKWKSDFGEVPDFPRDADGRYTITSKPHASTAETRSIRTECHLRLPIGQSQSSQTLTRDRDVASQPPAAPQSTPVWTGPETGEDPSGSIWGDSATDDSGRQPVVPGDDLHQRDNIWRADESADSQNRSGDDSGDNATTGPTSDGGPSEERGDPKIGERLSDGRVWFKPPWDEGGAYSMDEQEVQEIRDRQAAGYRWDKRHGWVNDQREEDVEDIADIQRRSDEKEKHRSRETFDQLSDSERKAKEHADKAKRHGDLSIMHKADALGLDSLTRDEQEKLPEADEDIKNHLRGDPTVVRGYKRGIVDQTMSQGAIDKTHTILQGAKVVIDESMNYLESAGGPPGKAISKTYTITSTIAGKASQANADFNAGKTDHLDYDTAVTEGFKEGVTNVIVDELSGELNNHVTDRLLNSKAGKGARDVIEDRVKRARNAKTKEFLSGKTDSLNPTVLDKAGENAAEQVKSKLNYTVGRTTKPAYDATLKQPVKDAVDWSTDKKDDK